jgi:hypothetical protein
METMGLVLAEIIADSGGSSASRIGFMNITTWADSKEGAGSKIERYLRSFGWHLVSIDEANIIDEDSGYGDEVTEMINSTRNNPNAIILGSFHTYKTN